MEIYVKNMVGSLCITMLQQELMELNIQYSGISLGKVTIAEESDTSSNRRALDAALKKWGLEILRKPEEILVEKIKSEIISLVYYHEDNLNVKLSCHLAERINCTYDYMSHVFKKRKSITIEHFFIAHKIKRVKELAIYHHLSLSEIAHKLHYCSLAHLSGQFKKIAGITFREFRHCNPEQADDRGVVAMQSITLPVDSGFR